MFALKALFVEGNRNPLVLTQKEVLIFLLSEEIFMGSTRTFEEPGFTEEKVILEARQLSHQSCSIGLCYQATRFLTPSHYQTGISMAQLTFSTRSQLPSQPVDCVHSGSINGQSATQAQPCGSAVSRTDSFRVLNWGWGWHLKYTQLQEVSPEGNLQWTAGIGDNMGVLVSPRISSESSLVEILFPICSCLF